MEKLIGELEATGATEIATKLREEWKTHATALDSLKAEHAAASASLKSTAKERDKFKADFEASGKTTDERIATLSKERDSLLGERDTFKTLAEQRAADAERVQLRAEVTDEYFRDITDKVTRRRAVDAFFKDYLPEGAGFDPKGKLQGFEAAVEAFKKAETWAVRPAEPGHGGGRGGEDPAPKVHPKGGQGAEAQALLAQLYPNDFKKGA